MDDAVVHEVSPAKFADEEFPVQNASVIYITKHPMLRQ